MGTQNPIDRPATVRAGEGLDLETLAAYLQRLFPDLKAADLEVSQFPSGHSNLTYLLRLGEHELVLRRPPFGAKIKSAHDMRREYDLLTHLAPVYPKVPRALAYCEDEGVIGAPFYLMERLKGVILRGALPQGLEMPAAQMRRLSENFLDNLVEIHGVDIQAAGLGDLGRPEGYVKRQVDGWAQRYHNARTDDVPEMEQVAVWLAGHMPPESGKALIHNDYKYDNLVEIHRVDVQAAGLGYLGRPEGYVKRQVDGWTKRYHNALTDDIPDMERVAAWLAGHMPPESGAALIHNDYKYDNLVLDPDDPTQIIGVLDWEMATIGDPLMDLGTSLGYWIDPDDPPEMQALNFGVTTLPGNLNRRELAERYARQSGRDLSNISFYYVYALFKIAVIVQQIYARYKAGHSQDERFAGMIFAVHVLSQTAVQATESS